jgi:hypothetical protein
MADAKAPLLTNRAFDALKWLAQIGLPGAGTLYFALAGLWNLPNVEQVVGSITAVDVFLGLMLGLSTTKYNKTAGSPDGQLIVTEDPDSGEKYLSLGVNQNVEAMLNKGAVKFNVVKNVVAPPAE